MARIRSIKPEFWTAEQVMELSRDARLLFVGLWNFCDDAGIHPAKEKTLKAEVFPSDDLIAADIRRLIDECISQGLVLEYEIDGERYWQVTGWHHQKIDQPTFKYPTPDGTIPAGAAKRRSEKSKESMTARKNSTNTRRTFDEHSTNTSRTFDECSPPESSRVESSRQERSKPPTSSVVANHGEGLREEAPPAALPAPDATRKGLVCRLLRQAGVSDAAPHHLTDANWSQILEKRSDEEIVEFARSKLESRSGQRTGLKYLAPGLLEDPQPISGPPGARGSPRMSARDAGRLAAARSIFGSEIEANHGSNGSTIIDVTPAASQALGAKNLR
ncbi:hypothetical protein J5J83_19840 [Azoarcus sp. L1K30]|uniref:hypothetical protein n=1 Tax=Azoarcus sp. L1K30 TaxID=2820277 RepID=UPI001B843CFF|nr:hypothetical protein [Azoarcus sp. L1K30]MBR0568380.1 hypothetical protein [Azoarcus sp. L1K30]